MRLHQSALRFPFPSITAFSHETCLLLPSSCLVDLAVLPSLLGRRIQQRLLRRPAIPPSLSLRPPPFGPKREERRKRGAATSIWTKYSGHQKSGTMRESWEERQKKRVRKMGSPPRSGFGSKGESRGRSFAFFLPPPIPSSDLLSVRSNRPSPSAHRTRPGPSRSCQGRQTPSKSYGLRKLGSDTHADRPFVVASSQFPPHLGTSHSQPLRPSSTSRHVLGALPPRSASTTDDEPNAPSPQPAPPSCRPCSRSVRVFARPLRDG